MTSAVLGAGTTLTKNAVTVAEVLRIGPVGSTAPEVEVTHLGSTAKEYIAGLGDGESLEFEFNYIDGNTEHEAFRDAVGTTLTDLVITWNDGSTATLSNGFVVLGFTRNETTPEAQLTATVTGRISGAIVWA